MLIISTKLYLLFIVQFLSCSSFITKPRLTLDEFFDSTMFTYLSISPKSQHLLIETVRPSWNTSSFENSLWIYDIHQRTRKIITKNLHKTIKPQWSPNGRWIALFLDESPSNTTDTRRHRRSIENYLQTEQHMYLYSLSSNDLLPINIGKDIPLAFTWSTTDFSLYLAAINPQPVKEDSDSNDEEWKDVIRYRDNKKREQTTIYRLDITEHHQLLSVKKNIVKNVSFLIGELLFAPSQGKLLIISMSLLVESLEEFEIYSIDLRSVSSPLVRLTDNEVIERNLRLSIDGIHVLFQSNSLGSSRRKFNDTQVRLYSLNLINGQMTRLAERFHGNINEYVIRSDGGVCILGQVGTEIQIYSQRTFGDDLVQHIGWNGTYESIALSNQQNIITFVHSSTDKAMEVYLINHMDQLRTAQPITDENKLFTQRDLPRSKAFQWTNEDDHRKIEGLLHYPPGRFQSKSLPLLVLIHGGPYGASVNRFLPDWYTWASLAASEGWLVLEPNYRGSTGYGDQFVSELRYRPLSLAGKDILYGVDQLIRDGVADPYRLSIGGYSYGGFLTNWLITQTKRFSAALSSAGAVDYTSSWGIMDLPVLVSYLFGGFPWEVPHIYQNEAPIYQLDRIRTPTLITTGEDDVRVPASQSYMMERGLYYRGIPVKLITFPNEGHNLNNNPWYGKIKIREELKWLKTYGNQLSFG